MTETQVAPAASSRIDKIMQGARDGFARTDRPSADALSGGYQGYMGAAGWTTQPLTDHPQDKLSKIKEDLNNGKFEDRLPDHYTMEKARNIELVGEDQSRTTFGDLYARKHNDTKLQKHLFIFVRHFFCGLCQDYIRTIASELPPSSLPPNTEVSIIGCGQPDMMADYRSKTSCPYPLYTDVNQFLYRTFSMSSNMAMGDTRPAYQTRSTSSMVLDSLKQNLGAGAKFKLFSGGPYSQLGGEMLFVDGEILWCHRMVHTRDHTEMEQLKKVLELS